jgi:hypothetical protein
MANWLVLFAGVYLIVVGLTAKTLINESDVVATEEARRKAKATPVKRLLVVGAGVAAVVYGAVRLAHWVR